MTTPTVTGVIARPDQIHDMFMDATNNNGVDTLLAMYDPQGIAVQQCGTTAEVSERQADGTWKLVIDDPMFA